VQIIAFQIGIQISYLNTKNLNTPIYKNTLHLNEMYET